MNNDRSFWLINSNRKEVKRFLKNNEIKDKFFEYIFIDTGEIIGVLGEKPPLMKTRVSVKINQAREFYKELLSEGWHQIKPFW